MSFITLSNHNIGYDEMTILLNTNGGDVDYAFAIYDQLKAQESKIRVVCNGPVMSAGTIILMAGDKREMTNNSYLLFHYGTDAAGCNNDRSHIDYTNERYNKLFLNNSKTTPKIIEEWYKTNVYYKPQEAMKLGLIQKVHGYVEEKKTKKRATRSRVK